MIAGLPTIAEIGPLGDDDVQRPFHFKLLGGIIFILGRQQ
jgi:hypothetical protein